MSLPARLLACALLVVCLSCSGEAFVQLPEIGQAKGWVLFNPGEPGQLFNSDVAANLVLEEGASLTALPMTSFELGQAPGEVGVTEGRLVPVLGSFVYSNSSWVPSEPVRLELPLDFAVCTEGCLSIVECSNCSISQSTQICGSCTEGLTAVDPELPDASCPAGWQLHETELGHQYCSAPVPAGISSPCPAEQRWSMLSQACVDYAPCAPPTVSPATPVVYVDPQAPVGGDGSAAAPLQQYSDTEDFVQVVLAPGRHQQPLTVERSNVRILGHGVCTQIAAPVQLMGQGITIDGVSIEVTGSASSAVRISAQADAIILRSRIVADARTIVAQGYLTLSDSTVQSHSGSAYAVDLFVGGSLSDCDIVATNAVTVRSGELDVDDSRLLGWPEPGIGVFSRSLMRGSLERVAVTGFNTGLWFAELDSDLTISDVLLRTFETAAGGGHGLLITGVDGAEAAVGLSRVDIDAEDVGVNIEIADVVAQDIRVRSDERAFVHTSNNQPRSLDVRRAWLDYSDVGFRTIDIASDISDVWLRRSSDRSENGTVTAMLGEACSVTGRRIHIVATGGDGITGFGRLDIDDLTLKDFRLAGVARDRGDDAPDSFGERWQLLGSGIGIDLVGGYALRDLSISAPASGDGITPICARPSARGTIVGFDLQRSVTRPSVALLHSDARASAAKQMRFSSGRLLPGRLVEKSSDCFSGVGVPDELPLFDNVAQRAAM